MVSQGVWHIFEKNGQVAEQQLTDEPDSLSTPTAMGDRASFDLQRVSASEKARVSLSLAVLGLTAAGLFVWARQRCASRHRRAPYETLRAPSGVVGFEVAACHEEIACATEDESVTRF